MYNVLEIISDKIIGPVVIVLIFLTGILLTIRLKGLQFRKSLLALKLMFDGNRSKNGGVSTFAALCVSLSATIGTGNIIGIATALLYGGPGALFWLVVISLIGLATKYSEGYLAVKYRKDLGNGNYLGGPFMYIENGMGHKWKWLAVIFAIFGAVAAVSGIGTATQSNGITDSFSILFTSFGSEFKYFTLFGIEISYLSLIIGIIITMLAALVLLGGVKRITSVCEFVVPIMAIVYVLCCLLIICLNITKVPSGIVEIFKSAFNFKSATGGIMGAGIMIAIENGAQKGIFANEAGLGSTPIALAIGENNNAVKTGLVSMGGMIVTVIICIMTGLVVVCTSSYTQGLEGINITNYAFVSGIYIFNSKISSILLLLCITFFAFSSIIGWELYGYKCLRYLVGSKEWPLKIYEILYLIAVLLGAIVPVKVIWKFADITNSLMAIPNLIALIALSKMVSKETLTDNLIVKRAKVNENR